MQFEEGLATDQATRTVLKRRPGVHGWSRTPPKPSAPRSPSPSPWPAAQEPPCPLPPGAEVEVRDNRAGYFGTWYEATVVGFTPAADHHAEEYLDWRCVRPAVARSLREVVPGAAVEVYCDGAWSPGVVRRAVGEGEYEVSVNCGEEGEVMVTKTVEMLRPHYWWDGNRWGSVKPKRQANLRQQSTSRKLRTSTVEVAMAFSYYEYSDDPEYSCTKKSRKERRQQEALLTGAPEHVPLSEIGNPISASQESPANNQFLNPCFLLRGHSTPPYESVENFDNTAINQELLSNIVLSENKGVQTHHIQPLQLGKKYASNDVHIQFKENSNPCIKETDYVLSASLECQAPTGTNSGSNMNVYTRQLKMSKGLEEPEAPRSSVNVTNPIQNGEREKGAESIRKSPLILGGTQFQTQQQLDKTLEYTLNLNEAPIENLAPQVSLGFELCVQNAESSKRITENNILGSCPVTGNSLPSHMSTSQISSHQEVFKKKGFLAALWPIMKARDAFRMFPQKPHFRPLLKLKLGYRQGEAIGLMVKFDRLVESIRKSTIADSMALLEEKRSTLHHLEENGFDVQSLQNYLIRLVQIKADNTRHLEEKDNLKAQILEKTASLSGIDLLIDENGKAVAELEKKLFELRHAGQMIAKNKERDDEELSRLKAADINVREPCAHDEQKFCSVLDELQRKHLT